jgi:hypothetical protein
MQPNNPNALNSMFGNLIYKHRKGLHKKKKQQHWKYQRDNETQQKQNIIPISWHIGNNN